MPLDYPPRLNGVLPQYSPGMIYVESHPTNTSGSSRFSRLAWRFAREISCIPPSWPTG
jgi:hypothetical protein